MKQCRSCQLLPALVGNQGKAAEAVAGHGEHGYGMAARISTASHVWWYFAELAAPTLVGNALASFTSLLPGLLDSRGAALSPAFSNQGDAREVGNFPVLAGVTWQPESVRQGYSKTAQTPCLVCLPHPLSLPRLFPVACDSSGRVGAAVLPRDA